MAVEAVPGLGQAVEVSDRRRGMRSRNRSWRGCNSTITLEQMDGLLAVIICNLKAAKLAGALRVPGLRAWRSEPGRTMAAPQVGINRSSQFAKAASGAPRLQKQTQIKMVQEGGTCKHRHCMALLAGQVSEGMVLAATSPDNGVVRILQPP